MQQASMQQASMQQASMQQASMQQASMQQASMQQASMQQASMQQASIQQASMHQASMQQASMQQASMQQASMQQASQIYNNEIYNNCCDFLLDQNNNLILILKNGSPNNTEFRRISASSNYQNYDLKTATAFGKTDYNSQFLLDQNNNLIMILKAGASNTTELHRLTAASNYQTFDMHIATGLGKSDYNSQFILDKNNNLVMILKNGASNKTEIHRLTASSNYQSFDMHVATALGTSNHNSQFMFDQNNNLVMILKNGASNTTEFHRLTASSNYQTFDMHIATGLGKSDYNSQFILDKNNNLVMILKNGASNTTELHRLTASSNYQTFDIHTATIIPRLS